MLERKPYSAPSAVQHEFGSEYLEGIAKSLESRGQELGSAPSQRKVDCDYVTVVDNDRKFVEVSDSFCQLVGYEREELLGRRYDELTAPNTNDIEKVFFLFGRLGYMHGLWMLVSRGGTRILVRYEAWLRPDSLIEGHMELVGAGY
jgi:PAS domain S-box-containing protein